MLRPYQQRAIDDLYAWLSANDGHPCLVLPTGAGKSHIVAALSKDALTNWPSTRVLMLTHQKELIEQNYSKLREHWPNAPAGIYSAGIGRRQLGEPITFAGIQSVRKMAARIGHIDLCLIDECHLVSHKQEGSYRTLIEELLAINPKMRVIGLTATPWRLGHGKITDDPALFDDLIEPVTIAELVAGGYLCQLRSKLTETNYDLDGIHKRGGEFIESELMARLDTDAYNFTIASEIVKRAGDRRSWLLFCTGVKHSQHMAEILRAKDVHTEVVTGETPKAERERILRDFKSGRIKCLTNANVLTTGFDAPNIDLIAMLRPTMSPSLYVQMAGRGLRIAEGKDDCLVLDFAGNVARHGPITAVDPPSRSGAGKGEAPTKSCEECWELVHISAKVCPACGAAFPEPEKAEKDYALRQDDIMGLEPEDMNVTDWRWSVYTSRKSGQDMLKCTYYDGLVGPTITEYFPILHGGYFGDKMMRQVALISGHAGVHLQDSLDIAEWADRLQVGRPPNMIRHVREGKYRRVMERIWH